MSDKGNVANEAIEAEKLHMKMHDIEPKVLVLEKDKNVATSETTANLDGDSDFSCEINMEAALNADDVIRAGGFGATDDIGSFLPVAMDATDFEASLRDAREFEGPQEDICRPGLGWKEPVKSDNSFLSQT